MFFQTVCTYESFKNALEGWINDQAATSGTLMIEYTGNAADYFCFSGSLVEL